MNEMEEIMEWIGKNMNNLPFEEQVAVFVAFSDFISKVKPIYAKHQLADGGSTFLFKL